MHNQIEAARAEHLLKGRAIADIDGGVREAFAGVLEALQVPQRVTRGAEEYTAHVVVHAENFVALAVEMLDRLGANQSAAAGDQNFHLGCKLIKIEA
jgi:hypothetical protein